MFVHFKKIDKPTLNDLTDLQYLGVTREPHEDPSAISVKLTEEEYAKWVSDPSLQYRYNVELIDGEWALTLLSERQHLPDMELVPMAEDDTSYYDVVIVLQEEKEALVHVYNAKMANDAKMKTVFYGVEAEDSMSALFEVEAAGADTWSEVKYKTDNVQVWVRAPLIDVSYGLKIIGVSQ